MEGNFLEGSQTAAMSMIRFCARLRMGENLMGEVVLEESGCGRRDWQPFRPARALAPSDVMPVLARFEVFRDGI